MSDKIEKALGEAKALLHFLRQRSMGPAPYYKPSGLEWDQVSQVANMLSEIVSDLAAAPQPKELYVDFPGIGRAGPFHVMDGVVTIPNATMRDLYAHRRQEEGT